MASRMAVMGLPNTGKSFSRQFIKNPEECFVISPSGKDHHLVGDGITKLDMKIGQVSGLRKVAAKLGAPSTHDAIARFSGTDLPPNSSTSGNYAVVQDMKYVVHYLKFIDRHMPQIKTVFLADFTHWISRVLTTDEFRRRKSGSEAFNRFWDLAADALTGIITVSDELIRDDLLIVTEYHAEYDESMDVFRFYVPAGKMLSEKFKPESYYDICLVTYVEEWDKGLDEADRYKFVTVKRDRMDGRGANLFADVQKEGMIPNNMQLVLERVRKKFNI